MIAILMSRYFPFLIVPFLLQSCCAGHSVTLKNNSGEDKIVTLRGHHYSTLSRKRYFQLKNVSGRQHGDRKPEKVEFLRIDSLANAYTFNLPKGKKVLVDGGLGFPDMGQQVIVNNSDTILMRGDERTRIKLRRIDFFFTVTVDVRSRRGS